MVSKNENLLQHSIIRIAAFALIFIIGNFYVKRYTGNWDVIFVLMIFGVIFTIFGLFLLIESIFLHKNAKIKSRNFNLISILIFASIITVYLNI